MLDEDFSGALSYDEFRHILRLFNLEVSSRADRAWSPLMGSDGL